MTVFKDGSDRILDANGFPSQLKRMAQQQGDGEDRAQGIRNSLPRDVGGGAVDGLVQADRASDTG